ncbi:MAG: hypothetical protein GKR98_06870 [Boseongicola sp.]|nr:MAG: hypothetical protein GKR98_06870 [Boseongicola sp.]
MIEHVIAGQSAQLAVTDRHEAMWQAARDLEAGFIAEMLKTAGLAKTPSMFGGGSGEDQFAGFLIDEQAKLIVGQGGIGLAESIYQSLMKRDGEMK